MIFFFFLVKIFSKILSSEFSTSYSGEEGGGGEIHKSEEEEATSTKELGEEKDLMNFTSIYWCLRYVYSSECLWVW